jgi:hypothetical protein
MADLKRDMAILVASGRDWAERTKRLAARMPKLDIFSQGLVERLDGGWRITEKGRAVLEIMEARPAAVPATEPPSIRSSDDSMPAATPAASPVATGAGGTGSGVDAIWSQRGQGPRLRNGAVLRPSGARRAAALQ